MENFSQMYGGVVQVTLAYVLLYYGFMINLLRVKVSVMKECKANGTRFDRYGQQYPALLAADRIQLNTLEHMPPFLIVLWLHAVVVSAESAMWLGWVYVGLRALYPLFLGSNLQGNIPVRVLFNTFSAYGVLGILSVWTFLAL